MANSENPDQTAPSGADRRSGLFAYGILSDALVFEILGMENLNCAPKSALYGTLKMELPRRYGSNENPIISFTSVIS